MLGGHGGDGEKADGGKLTSTRLDPGDSETHSVDAQGDRRVHRVPGEGDQTLRPEAAVAAVR